MENPRSLIPAPTDIPEEPSGGALMAPEVSENNDAGGTLSTRIRARVLEISTAIYFAIDNDIPEIMSLHMRTRILKIIGTISALIYFALNDDDSKIQQLTPHEREIITVAADTFFPEGGPIPLSGTQAGVPEYVENTFNNAPDYHKKFMHLLFHFIELIALFRYATLFTLLHNPKKQKKVLDFTDMFIYFRRVAFMSLRQLCTMGYLANRKVGKQIGYLKDSPDIPASRD